MTLLARWCKHPPIAFLNGFAEFWNALPPLDVAWRPRRLVESRPHASLLPGTQHCDSGRTHVSRRAT